MAWSTLTAAVASLLLATTTTTSSAVDAPSVFTPESNSSLLWGPYKPNLYFGLRPRLPKSLTTSLLWSRVEDFTSVQNNVRYTCEQHEGMAGYGWDLYDPRTGGVQTVRDRGNGVDVETSFVKFGEDGKEGWGARVKGTPREDRTVAGAGGEELKTAVWLAVGMEGLGAVEVEGLNEEDENERGVEGDVVFSGQTADLGEFKLRISESEANNHPTHRHPSSESKPLDNTFIHSLQVPEDALWQAKALLFGSMKTTIDNYVEEYTPEKMPPPWQTYTIQHRPGTGNMHLIQKTFEGAFEFDVFYTPASSTPPTSAELTKKIDEVVKGFEKKFSSALAPQAPFTGKEYERFSYSLFSNLIGGLGYFHGDQLIDRSYDPAYEEENEGFEHETAEARSLNRQKLEGPYTLFTSIPSRPFFPRGFLWDEGFHLLPIVDFDPELVMQVISSWFSTMDEDGWIPREQILGGEARSKVPQEFQVQYPHYANPPTLFMTISALLDNANVRSSSASVVDKDLLSSWLKQLYPLLQRNFAWYRRTQSGDLKSYDRPPFQGKEAYRWRGRTAQHILTSGLDDYPRAQPPHPGELHVDLMAWMGMMASSLQRVAEFIGEEEDARGYGKVAENIRRNVESLHWDEGMKTYCDVTVDDYEDSVRVCHKGYISIFPFMVGLMGAEHEHLGEVLEVMADEEELWSPFGIRSLSRSDELYGTAENYWRSPVWMNMNYLIVQQLLSLAQQPGPYRQKAATMYAALRKNLVDTVYRSWKETGFAWEQYNPETGQGQRTQHFTGWTSLVVKIAAMPDIGRKGTGHDEL